MTFSNKSLSKETIGKRVMDDLYVHVDYADRFLNDPEIINLIEIGRQLMSEEDLVCCNVIKLNLRKQRLSFLQYFEFDHDPFPSLNGSFVIDPIKKTVTHRSYSSSLNPPILHRKELLVSQDHPNRLHWELITKNAEELGFFSTSSPIGFRENWIRIIAEKGFKLIGHSFIPLGNEVAEELLKKNCEEISQIQRHLTALSRSTISAPIQLLLGHGLINSDTTIFDYGCGRGDDAKGLENIGIKCLCWDPHYAPDNLKIESEIVNLGFVVNVIEDPAERVEAIQKAFALATTALVISVMLYSNDRPGKPYRDGFLTVRNTFQKYFSQDEFKDYVEKILEHDPIMIGPGIAIVFRDKDAEQRFLLNRYRSSNVARRLLNARLSPRIARAPRAERIRNPRITKSEREFTELKPVLDNLWSLTLDLGRFPESFEIPELQMIQEKISLTRAIRLIRTHYDLGLLEESSKTRSDEIKLYIASLQFGKKAPYKQLEPKLRLDIRYFFGDYRAATSSALRLLLDSGKTEIIHMACKEAAANGLGWLDEDHSLQLHSSLVERLPAVLRAYISCGLLLWNNISSVQLIKIHIGSGKLTLLKYDDFDDHPIPLLVKRVKVNIRHLDYDVFDYQEPQYPPSPLLYKSRYMHEDMHGFAEQVEFDEKLEATGVVDQLEPPFTRELIERSLEIKRLEIHGICLARSSKIPSLDQECGSNLTYRDLIECGETQNRLGLKNLPLNPATYNAMFDLCTKILDPVIDYFGSIQLTYGFSSKSLASKIDFRIAPKLDQHASHECNRQGNLICDRLGAAIDFIVEDESMLEVAQWIVRNTSFDRLYFYGIDRPIHVSFSETPVSEVTLMLSNSNDRRIPKNISFEHFMNLTASSIL